MVKILSLLFCFYLAEGEVPKGHIGKQMQNGFRLLSLVVIYHRVFIFYMLIGLGKYMTPFRSLGQRSSLHL